MICYYYKENIYFAFIVIFLLLLFLFFQIKYITIQKFGINN